MKSSVDPGSLSSGQGSSVARALGGYRADTNGGAVAVVLCLARSTSHVEWKATAKHVDKDSLCLVLSFSLSAFELSAKSRRQTGASGEIEKRARVTHKGNSSRERARTQNALVKLQDQQRQKNGVDGSVWARVWQLPLTGGVLAWEPTSVPRSHDGLVPTTGPLFALLPVPRTLYKPPRNTSASQITLKVASSAQGYKVNRSVKLFTWRQCLCVTYTRDLQLLSIFWD